MQQFCCVRMGVLAPAGLSLLLELLGLLLRAVEIRHVFLHKHIPTAAGEGGDLHPHSVGAFLSSK